VDKIEVLLQPTEAGALITWAGISLNREHL